MSASGPMTLGGIGQGPVNEQAEAKMASSLGPGTVQGTQRPTTLRAEVDIISQQVNRLFELLNQRECSANDRIAMEESGFEEISRRLQTLEHEVGLDVPRPARFGG